jgi:2-polyprenyl-3-methyl-5-hydroxy-6-metoxy-1,4-benzoquinol methylase
MKVYVVTAYRWGDREKHSYVVGAFDNEENAIKEAKLETEWRGGKYECEVRSMELNESLKYKNYDVVLALPKPVLELKNERKD